jgi:hypothetical protein
MQLHGYNHSFSCFKNKWHRECRFNYGFPIQEKPLMEIDDETGNVSLLGQRYFGNSFVVAHNIHFLNLLRSNTDTRLIFGSDANDVRIYICGYVSKSQQSNGDRMDISTYFANLVDRADFEQLGGSERARKLVNGLIYHVSSKEQLGMYPLSFLLQNKSPLMWSHEFARISLPNVLSYLEGRSVSKSVLYFGNDIVLVSSIADYVHRSLTLEDVCMYQFHAFFERTRQTEGSSAEGGPAADGAAGGAQGGLDERDRDDGAASDTGSHEQWSDDDELYAGIDLDEEDAEMHGEEAEDEDEEEWQHADGPERGLAPSPSSPFVPASLQAWQDPPPVSQQVSRAQAHAQAHASGVSQAQTSGVPHSAVTRRAAADDSFFSLPDATGELTFTEDHPLHRTHAFKRRKKMAAPFLSGMGWPSIASIRLDLPLHEDVGEVGHAREKYAALALALFKPFACKEDIKGQHPSFWEAYLAWKEEDAPKWCLATLLQIDETREGLHLLDTTAARWWERPC